MIRSLSDNIFAPFWVIIFVQSSNDRLIISRKNKKSTRFLSMFRRLSRAGRFLPLACGNPRSKSRTAPEEGGSGFPNEFLAALGTFDADLAAVFGNADHLPAVGTAVIAVLPVGDPGLALQEAAIFQGPGLQIPRKGPEEVPDQQAVGKQLQYERDQGANSAEPGQDHSHDAQDHGADQQKAIQLIQPVTPVHEAPQTFGKPLQHSSEHDAITLGHILYETVISRVKRRFPPGPFPTRLIISAFPLKSSKPADNLRNV